MTINWEITPKNTSKPRIFISNTLHFDKKAQIDRKNNVYIKLETQSVSLKVNYHRIGLKWETALSCLLSTAEHTEESIDIRVGGGQSATSRTLGMGSHHIGQEGQFLGIK